MATIPIESWEWDMVFGGDAPPELAERARRDPAFDEQRRRWEGDQREEARWRATLFRADCPETLDLGDYAAGQLEPDTAQRLAAHVSDCPHCQVELDTIRAMRAGPLTDPPPRARRSLKRVVLELVDSLTGSPMQPALRGDSQSVRYASGSYMLSLTRRGAREGGQLIGSLLAPATHGTVALRRGSEVVQETPLSSAATFTLDEIPGGEYELVIALSTIELVVPRLQIEP